jgi:Protein kinase domain
MTQSGLLMGTPGYMSPEQVMGKRIDHRSDIFAAGLVLYELLSYRRAFDGGLEDGFVYRLLHDEPDDISTLVPGISADVTTIVRRALRKDPAERYDSIADMASAIRKARRHIGNASTTVTLPQLGSGPPPPLRFSTDPEPQMHGEGGTGIDRRSGRVPVVSSPKGDEAAAPAARAPDAPRTPRYFALSDKRLRWSLATASVLAIVALGLYRLGRGDAGTSQPRPTTAPSTESALQLNAVMTAGGKPLPSGVGYDVYEAAKDADGNRKPVTESPAYKEPPRFPLPAGRYYVTASSDVGKGDSEVTISQGETHRIQLRLRRP